MLTKRQQIRIASIKQQNAHSREIIDLMQTVVDSQRDREDNTPEINEKLLQMEIDLGEHRILIADNEALIAKLETPIWKIWKLF
jgi:hypothetical protein